MQLVRLLVDYQSRVECYSICHHDRVDDINISTATGANTALSIIDSAIASVDSQRATLGAVQNRFDSVVSNLMNVSLKTALPHDLVSWMQTLRQRNSTVG